MNRQQKIELLKARMNGSELFPIYDGCDVLYLEDDGRVCCAETENEILKFDPPITEKEFKEKYASDRKILGFTTKRPPLVGVDYEESLKQSPTK